MKKGLCCTLALMGMSLSSSGWAAGAFDPDGDFMFGDWGGARTDLADQGVNFRFEYISEMAYSVDGGFRDKHTGRYADQWTAGANFDLDRLFGVPNARFQLTLTDRNGESLTNDVINNPNSVGGSSSQEVYGRGSVTRITQLWYGQSYMDDTFEIKAGRVPVGDDFAVIDSNFQNLYLGSGEPGNQNGGIWYNWPISQWALVGKWNITSDQYAQIGFFNLNESNLDRDHGLDLKHSGTSGTLIPVEYGFEPEHGFNDLPGHYRLGYYYSSADADDYSSRDKNSDAEKGHRYGLYYVIDQQVTSHDNDRDRGLGVFSMGTWNDGDTATFDRYLSAGVTYTGPFDGREQDEVGLGLAYAHVNDDYNDWSRSGNASLVGGSSSLNYVPHQGEEYNAEVYYSLQTTNWLAFRPNLQFVRHPGADSDVDNAWIAGLSVLATF